MIQEPVEGRLGRVQSIFAAGRLVALHACAQVEEGVGGGDLVKESLRSEELEAQVELLGSRLGWHGALSLDFIEDPSGRRHFIDANPRLAEPGNALAAGLNLPELLVRVSLGESPPRAPLAPPGVRSFMALQGLFRTAKDSGSRAAVCRTLRDIVTHRGSFAAGAEELTPLARDPASAIPVLVVAGALIGRPRVWEGLSRGAVDAYAATPRVVEFVRGRSSCRAQTQGTERWLLAICT